MMILMYIYCFVIGALLVFLSLEIVDDKAYGGLWYTYILPSVPAIVGVCVIVVPLFEPDILMIIGEWLNSPLMG